MCSLTQERQYEGGRRPLLPPGVQRQHGDTKEGCQYCVLTLYIASVSSTAG
jgi:hypothetical protein